MEEVGGSDGGGGKRLVEMMGVEGISEVVPE